MPRPMNVGVDLGGVMGLFNQVTGNTPKQKQARFFDEELPELANRFFQTDPQDAEGHARNAIELMKATAKAGLNDKVYETVLNQLTGPTRAKTATHVYDEIGSGRQQRAGKMLEQDITGMAPGAGDAESLEAFRRQGDFNQDDALKLGRAEARHGIKIPAHLAENIRVPSQVALDNATKRLRQVQQSIERTENRLADMQADELEGLGNEAGIVGRATRGRSLAPYLSDERDRVQRQPKVDSDVRLNDARTGTEGYRQRELGTQSTQNLAGARYNDAGTRLRDRTDPNIRAGGAGSAGSETTVETEGPVRGEEIATAGRRIAATAKERGTTDAASIKRIAEEFGYELSGDASVETLKEPGAFYGENVVKDKKTGRPVIALKGSFQLKRRPQTKTTRKVPAGAATPSGAASSKEALLKKYGLD
jgi:hypothetical protein